MEAISEPTFGRCLPALAGSFVFISLQFDSFRVKNLYIQVLLRSANFVRAPTSCLTPVTSFSVVLSRISISQRCTRGKPKQHRCQRSQIPVSWGNATFLYAVHLTNICPRCSPFWPQQRSINSVAYLKRLARHSRCNALNAVLRSLEIFGSIQVRLLSHKNQLSVEESHQRESQNLHWYFSQAQHFCHSFGLVSNLTY